MLTVSISKTLPRFKPGAIYCICNTGTHVPSAGCQRTQIHAELKQKQMIDSVAVYVRQTMSARYMAFTRTERKKDAETFGAEEILHAKIKKTPPKKL